MDTDYSQRTTALMERLTAFMQEHIYPNEARFDEEVAQGERWQPLAMMEELKRKARAQGLWNLFLPAGEQADGLSNYEYAPLAEIMGRVRMGCGSVQLFGARHRQHGSAGALRDRRRRSVNGWSRCSPARSVRRSQ